MKLGNYIKQPEGYVAFVPTDFPPKELLDFPGDLITKAAKAERLIGKLDGTTHLLPDADFFLNMYIVKDATYSSQIEGTRATMLDAIELSAGIQTKDTDADDILFYISAMHYGIKRLDKLPFSLRFIRELHKELMIGARSTHFADPGEFRKSQNWIGGTTINNAQFIPPPVHEMNSALSHFEKFIHDEKLMPVLQAGILHAQFETIHPFLDGNGRTGRLIISLFLYQRQILERPVLFLSSFFKKHQQEYYNKLNAYHQNKPFDWLDFYLEGVIQTAEESIETSKKITTLREEHMRRIQALGKREASSGIVFLQNLFRSPITTNSIVVENMGFSRSGAAKLIERFIELGILEQMDENLTYGKTFIYRKYIEIFSK